jgi:hypothetical protein
MLYRDHEAAAVEKAVELALISGVSSGKAVRHLLHPREPGPGSITLLCWRRSVQTDVSVYSDLGGV